MDAVHTRSLSSHNREHHRGLQPSVDWWMVDFSPILTSRIMDFFFHSIRLNQVGAGGKYTEMTSIAVE